MLRIKAGNIQLIVYDFDGVFTDNKVLVMEDGKEAVFCNRSDGLAIQKIKKARIPQIIFSTEDSPIIKMRARKLEIPFIKNINDKKLVLLNYCKKKKYRLEKIIYLGNDLNDLGAMKLVGYPIASADAHASIKKIATIILKAKGGGGVVREFLDIIKLDR